MGEVFSLSLGTTPLVVSFPHDGTEIPPELEVRLTPAARLRPTLRRFVEVLLVWASERRGT